MQYLAPPYSVLFTRPQQVCMFGSEILRQLKAIWRVFVGAVDSRHPSVFYPGNLSNTFRN